MENEFLTVSDKRLGRRNPSNKPSLKLGNVLAQVPAHPLTKTNLSEVIDYGLYDNDKFGICGPTSAANYYKLITHHAGSEYSPTQQDVFDLYRRSGNPNFDPNTGADDNGVDMQTMLNAMVKGGLANKQVIAFAKVDVTNLNEVKAAIDIFGGVLLGVNLLVAQQNQTDTTKVWDYVRSSEWGGHAVLCGNYSDNVKNDFGVITWAELVDTTDSFWTHQVEEAWVVILKEHFSMPGFDSAVDVQQLADDYKALTGKTLVIPPSPNPTPTPNPVPVSAWTKILDEIAVAVKNLEDEIKSWFK